MAFNQYLWNLYLKAGGREVVDKFNRFLNNEFESEYPAFIAELMKDYCPDQFLIDRTKNMISTCLKEFPADSETVEAANAIDDNEQEIMVADTTDESDAGESMPEKEELDETILTERLHLMMESGWKPKWAFDQITREVPGITTIYAYDDPENYFPYYFSGTFNVLERILSYFEMERPHVPGKARYEERLDYYEQISFILNDFREEVGLSPAEMWALMYDYAPKVTGGMNYVVPEGQLGKPHRVFVFGDDPRSTVTDPTFDHIISHQGNPDMQPGDIAVLYRWGVSSKKIPGSFYDSVWRAVAPGFYDPLSYHDRNVFYAHPIGIPKVTIADLKADPIFSNTNLVRSKMTQMDGAKMTNHEYLHLLDMAAQKGNLPDSIPRVPDFVERQEVHIELERDVEEQMLEPLLARLGWEPQDYIRQMAVRIGRGVTKYPDYVLNYDTAGPSGEIVIEAKKTIPSLKQAEHDNGQARSYAKLIGARATALVSMEGVWVSTKEDGFTAMTAFKWEELQDADIFNRLYQVIGKGTAKRVR